MSTSLCVHVYYKVNVRQMDDMYVHVYLSTRAYITLNIYIKLDISIPRISNK